MQLTKIEWSKPVATVKLTRGDLALLLKCSANHYDGVCRDASIPGPKAFLNAWRHMFPATPTFEPDESITVQTDFSELDTAAKILEVPSASALEDHATINRRTELRFCITQALKALNTFATETPRGPIQPHRANTHG